MPETRTAARLIADALVANRIERVFCVPGESYLALLDALYDTDVAVVVCRHEGAATMAAEAYGKLTGRPGIALVTRGPGATNASAGVHVARHDSTPLILFVGQVARRNLGRDAFQEIDIGAFFAPIAKAVDTIDRADRAAEVVSRAFHVATSGRPGPVVVSLPEDVLRDSAVSTSAEPWQQVHTHPGLTFMAQLQKMLWAADRPLAVVGGSRWGEAAVAGFRRFAERFDLPVAASFRRQHLFNNDHPNYVGNLGAGANPKLLGRIRDADVLLVVGGRMGDLPSAGFTAIDIPEPRQALVHVHPGAEELGRLYRPALAIHASPAAFVSALESLQPPHRAIAWTEHTKSARADYETWSAPVANPGPVQLAGIVTWLRQRLPDDAIVTFGAGNYALWVQRFFRFRRHHTQLASTSGSMGYGLPAALSAKLAHPNVPVVCFAGDGDFQMTSNDFQTAVQFGAAIVVVVVNNGVHGTIRMHQERNYPGRQIATA
ncbi:MAG TPA: thiamine pyrophosphate-binding protein, partial [Bauldia sp.]|nr:thiamine pyrophosphate-binding protein [Bauldia sp.]